MLAPLTGEVRWRTRALIVFVIDVLATIRIFSPVGISPKSAYTEVLEIGSTWGLMQNLTPVHDVQLG